MAVVVYNKGLIPEQVCGNFDLLRPRMELTQIQEDHSMSETSATVRFARSEYIKISRPKGVYNRVSFTTFTRAALNACFSSRREGPIPEWSW